MKVADLSQTEVAELFDADRSTVARWQRQGMPHTPPAKNGLAATYHAPVVLHWRAGDQWAKANRLELSPAQKIAVSWARCVKCDPKPDELPLFAGLLKKAGIRENPDRLIGFAIALHGHPRQQC